MLLPELAHPVNAHFDRLPVEHAAATVDALPHTGGRKGERRSMSEADYAGLITAARQQLQAPVILVWAG